MAHAPIPYYPLAVVLNKENNFRYSQQLRPPISGYSSLKVMGPQDVLISCNVTRPSYLLDADNPLGNSIDGLIAVGYRTVEYELYSQDIHFLEISLYKNTTPALDSIPLMLLFLN